VYRELLRGEALLGWGSEGRFSVRVGENGGGAGERQCWDVGLRGVGHAEFSAERTVRRLT
jgi:hypothetical protein